MALLFQKGELCKSVMDTSKRIGEFIELLCFMLYIREFNGRFTMPDHPYPFENTIPFPTSNTIITLPNPIDVSSKTSCYLFYAENIFTILLLSYQATFCQPSNSLIITQKAEWIVGL